MELSRSFMIMILLLIKNNNMQIVHYTALFTLVINNSYHLLNTYERQVLC